jgi:hypothetical protein
MAMDAARYSAAMVDFATKGCFRLAQTTGEPLIVMTIPATLRRGQGHGPQSVRWVYADRNHVYKLTAAGRSWELGLKLELLAHWSKELNGPLPIKPVDSMIKQAINLQVKTFDSLMHGTNRQKQVGEYILYNLNVLQYLMERIRSIDVDSPMQVTRALQDCAIYDTIAKRWLTEVPNFVPTSAWNGSAFTQVEFRRDQQELSGTGRYLVCSEEINFLRESSLIDWVQEHWNEIIDSLTMNYT